MTQDLIPLLETEKSKQCKNKLLRFVIMHKIMDQVMIKKIKAKIIIMIIYNHEKSCMTMLKLTNLSIPGWWRTKERF